MDNAHMHQKMTELWQSARFDDDCRTLEEYCTKVITRLDTWCGLNPEDLLTDSDDPVELAYTLLTHYHIIRTRRPN